MDRVGMQIPPYGLRVLSIALVLVVSLFTYLRFREPTSSPSAAYIPPAKSYADYETDNEATSPLQQRLSEVYNSTLGFEKVFVVSLPSRTDHRDTIALTSALTGFNVEFIDGVKADEISDKVMPPELGEGLLRGGAKGAWRAHMNALREIVMKGYGSALIAEEDFDWDIRLKDQLADMAIATTGVSIQHPSNKGPIYAEYPGETIEFSALSKWLQSQSHNVEVPSSPYGHGWDVLWLGNCAIRDNPRNESWNPLSVARRGDPTTNPSNQYWTLDWGTPLPVHNFPNHTRLFMSQPTDQVCTIAYAVSQQGARRLLFELGLERADKAFDLMLQDFCQGGWKGGLAEPHACWGVMPSIFASYVAAGPASRDSDIGDDAEQLETTEVHTVGYSLNLQQSVRTNARKILSGQLQDITDHYPFDEGTF